MAKHPDAGRPSSGDSGLGPRGTSWFVSPDDLVRQAEREVLELEARADALERLKALQARRDRASAHLADPEQQARGPGRPGWTETMFRARYQDALTKTSPPHTIAAIAANFVGLAGETVDAGQLGKLMRRFPLK